VRASLLDTLDDFERWSGDCAYVFPRGYRRERWTYQRVAGVAYQFARELQARNIFKGDAVLLWSPNCAEWVAAFLGCALCGAIAVPVDDASSPEFAQRISAQVRTKLVLCPRERAAVFEKAQGLGAGAIGDEARPRPTGAAHQNQIPTIDPADLALAIAGHPSQRFRPVEIQPSDTLEIVFTSGTTAEPKGVVLTHANVVGNLAPVEAEIKKYLKYERLVHPIRFLDLLPLSHVFGQFLGIFLPPLLGGTVVFENTFNPTEIMATIRREHVSVLVAVPRMIESLKQKIERDAEGNLADFAARYTAARNRHFLRRWWTFRDVRRRFGWKFWAIISGGATLDRETEEFWHRLGYAVVQGYGLTETTSLISLNHPFHTSRGSIGKVLAGREVKLAEDGEILVRGVGVASNYWKDHDFQPLAQDEDEGWYRTGDLGAIDGQGNLFFKGRKKEVIVTPAGMNIFPEDLEAALRQQTQVKDCVVVGLEHGGNAEPCAVLILREGREKNDQTVNAVIQRANAILAEYQRMRAWFVWPEEDFPRSSTQKPKRNLVREAVEASLRGQPVADGASPLSELLTRIKGRTHGIQHLAPDANLENALGLSSLERVELFSALEDRYQIDLSETDFARVATVGDLEKLLQGNASVWGRSSTQSMRGIAPSPHKPLPAPERKLPEFHYPGWVLHWPATWLRMAVRYVLARPAMFLLARPRVIGRENLRDLRGPALVVSNHISDVDIGFIQTALPERLRHKLATATRGEALEALRSPSPDRTWLARIYDRAEWVLAVALLNLFPLPRHAGFRRSFAYAGEAVDRGYSILVFPEGKHTTDGKIHPFQAGVGLLANNLRIPIVPMRIDGLFEIKQAGKKHAPPGKIQVRIGNVIYFAPDTTPERIAQVLQKAVESI
jgi:long-chain acyl-CoA synthetase